MYDPNVYPTPALRKYYLLIVYYTNTNTKHSLSHWYTGMKTLPVNYKTAPSDFNTPSRTSNTNLRAVRLKRPHVHPRILGRLQHRIGNADATVAAGIITPPYVLEVRPDAGVGVDVLLGHTLSGYPSSQNTSSAHRSCVRKYYTSIREGGGGGRVVDSQRRMTWEKEGRMGREGTARPVF